MKHASRCADPYHALNTLRACTQSLWKFRKSRTHPGIRDNRYRRGKLVGVVMMVVLGDGRAAALPGTTIIATLKETSVGLSYAAGITRHLTS